MSDPIGMGVQVAAQAARFGWYFALNRAVTGQTRRSKGQLSEGEPAAPAAMDTVAAPTTALPSEREILKALADLFLRDADAVRNGIYPPTLVGDGPIVQIMRARGMLADLPDAARRTASRDATTARDVPTEHELPDYYRQDFHFQTDGYLSDRSARLYDTQVETLFLGGAAPMRREALRPIADFMRGRDQRHVRLLDVACGTGRFLRDVRIAYPAMELAGLDLSTAYLDEAKRAMGRLRPARWIAGNAEAIPLPDASQDIVTTIFLFHELPPDVRRRAVREMARVLKPDGLLVFIDSLQLGDRPGWDELLRRFPQRLHEPYFRNYLIDDLGGMLTAAGLEPQATWTSYFSRVMARRKA